ncbi:hypothetical protein TIFTF001_047167 [Ficus carica]|uniref:Uncharacterized protein n=1 Tax=Ficus carica TaxID=3494 RepID=A0AA88CLC5_FICCA|nr:hypothetical protein TIFTF001_047167 [Ficus carica]
MSLSLLSPSLLYAGGFVTMEKHLNDGNAYYASGFRNRDLISSTVDDDDDGLGVGAPSVSSGDCNREALEIAIFVLVLISIYGEIWQCL